MAGYSGTPLVKKLGVAEGSKLFVINAPTRYRATLEPLISVLRKDRKELRGKAR